MASTASKSIPLLKTIAHGAFQFGNHVVAELRTPRIFHCDIPSEEDNKPRQLIVDETKYGSGLWTARFSTYLGFSDMPYDHVSMIKKPVTTSTLLHMLDDMIDEKRKYLDQKYINSYEKNIQAELKDILKREQRRIVPQHPANEP